jgi:hypothetical protein
MPTGAIRRTDLELDGARKARAAIERGDKEAALQALDEILAEEKPIHDLYGDMAASLVTFIASKLGEDAVDAAWRHVADDVWRPVLMHFKSAGDVAALAGAFALFLKSHRYDFEVWEDDEKWVYTVNWCTSGERMLVEGKVAHHAGDPNGNGRFGVTERAHPWSFDRAGLPYYDVHAALWMRILPREWDWPVIDCEYGTKPNGHFAVTKYVIYKRPRA